jgi:hypothetical protein
MHAHRVHRERSKALWAVVGSLVLILGTSALLWRFEALRPYIAAFAAALAAFLAPIPGLLTPETRGKWLFTVGVAAAIGLGTWYSSEILARENRQLQKEGDELKRRFQLEQDYFKISIKRLRAEDKEIFLIDAGKRLNEFYVQHRFQPTLDLVSVMTDIDTANGHALYFAGEQYRGVRNQTDMRGAFQHYLAIAKHNPEASIGEIKACGTRASGYCGERTAWIKHLMARDFYGEAIKFSGDRQFASLRTAFDYEQTSLDICPSGFDRDGTLESSAEILRGIGLHFKDLGQSTTEVDAALMKPLGHHLPCAGAQ